MRKALLAAAFAALLLTGAGAFAEPTPTKLCYKINEISMWDRIVLVHDQKICVPLPGVLQSETKP